MINLIMQFEEIKDFSCTVHLMNAKILEMAEKCQNVHKSLNSFKDFT